MVNKNEIKVLDGYVMLEGSSGNDLTVVNAARASFNKNHEEMEPGDDKLIDFLLRSGHSSPFEMIDMTFRVKAPKPVICEWQRHRMSCLDGDTEIFFELPAGRPSGKPGRRLYKIKIKDLYRKSLPTRSKRKDKQLNPYYKWDRVKEMNIRSLDEASNVFFRNKITNVYSTGDNPVYKITLENKKEITCTTNHKFITREGWQTIGEALKIDHTESGFLFWQLGTELVTNGQPSYRDFTWMKSRRDSGFSVQEIADQAGCSYHTIRKWLKVLNLQFTEQERFYYPKGHTPWNKGLNYSLPQEFSEKRLQAIKLARGGSASNFWKGGTSSARTMIGTWTAAQKKKLLIKFDYKCAECGLEKSKYHAHHIVAVATDITKAYDFDNLELLCVACHRAEHKTSPKNAKRPKPVSLSPVFSRVKKVEYIGIRPTYDLEVEGPNHNFVANGIVVHNSFNEQSGRYVVFEPEFFIPVGESIRKQTGKPGHYKFERITDMTTVESVDYIMRECYDFAYQKYQDLMNLGLAKEVARNVLPFGFYSTFYYKANLRSLFNFLSLRNDDRALLEIQEYAKAVEVFVSQVAPISYASFVANGRKAI